MHLHDIPPEVIGEILCALHDPNDLRAFLAASPTVLRVFNLFRDRILLAVSLNAIEPEVRPIALAIRHVPYMKTNADINLQHGFLNDYFGGKVYEPPTKSQDIKSFCGLVCRILYFVDRFAAEAWSLLHDGAGDGAASPALSPLVLSRAERTAFQRGFFLVELYGNVFPSYRTGFDESVIGTDAQIDHFLSRIHPWDVEAMVSVLFYQTRFIHKHTLLAEDDIVARVMALPTAYRLATKSRPSGRNAVTFTSHDLEHEDPPPAFETVMERSERRLRDGNWYFFFRMDYERHGIVMFSKAHRVVNDFVAYLSVTASLQSLFMYKLAHRDGIEKTRLVTGSYVCLWKSGFLDDAAQVLRQRPVFDHDDRGAPKGMLGNGSGFNLYRPSLRTDRPLFDVEDDRALNGALRARGYVFWDADRTKQPAFAARLQQAHDLPRDEVARLYNEESFGPSVQERLEDIGLYHNDLYDLLDDTEGEPPYNDKFSP
ncbi:uncharacterized protein SPSK_06268 [Sporothrix schenckii 1099-18]|uniref:Uncharacterized protein n=1 Tax=Sporothrix schenckii 1099-18 TaxID=1397361 RepID=A0A0F2MN95_SPOSC|nr:uncharacterized protein SPSK_06268 [Sporothrix schenckii 1099-18]KJR89651.1 hypothetical protein SPSK_06268 [Sporothrix schenckii 1099-18]